MSSKVNPRAFRFAMEAIVAGVATAGGANTITLAAGTIAANGDKNQRFIVIVSGTGAGQSPRRIIDSVAATQVATVEPAWDAGGVPDGTSNYVIFDALTNFPFEGTAQAGAAQTITLGVRESTKDDYYTGLMLEIMYGTGAPPAVPAQVRQIINYVGATRVATVNAPWGTNPDATSRYRIQGHLYFPVSHLELYEEGGANFRAAYQPGAIAYGQYEVTPHINHDSEFADIRYLEYGLEPLAPAGILTVMRAEGAGGHR